MHRVTRPAPPLHPLPRTVSSVRSQQLPPVTDPAQAHPPTLPGAFARNTFVLHYQPIVSMTSGQPVAAEALLRWQPPGRPLVSPRNFLSDLEASGKMVEVSTWVLHQACRTAAQQPGLRIAVNLSQSQFQGHHVVATVKRALHHTGLCPSRLELEVTETMILTASCATSRTLRRLKDSGVHITLDDFGTGYANLACLQAFPFDGLKIDRSLIRPLQRATPRSLTVVSTIVELGRRLHLEVTAEGIETPRQLQHLQGMDIDRLQGYLLALPQAAWPLSIGTQGRSDDMESAKEKAASVPDSFLRP